LDIQLNIWIGNTVNSSFGPDGTKGTYARAPVTISGAASPTALDKARITPVSIPPKEAGNTWFQTVCHLDAPKAKEPSRILLGTAFIDSRVVTMMMGSISNESVKAPASKLAPRFIWRTKISR